MSLPVTTARINPETLGRRPLHNGFQALVALNGFPALGIFERAVTPFGWDGGDEIDIATMFNTEFRPKASRELSEATPLSMRVGYDPDHFLVIQGQINENQAISLHFPNGTTIDFYGWLKSFIPSEMEDGVFPEADVEIIVSNYDPVNCIEVGPVITESTGTC